MRAVQVAPDRWNFQYEGGGYVTPIGGNILNDQHPGQGTLFQRFDAQDIDRRLGLMADIGLNCLRQAIGVNEVFSAKTGLKPDGLRNWDAFIKLAEKHRIYLMPVGGYVGGNDWFDVERLADSGQSLDESCIFWEQFVSHYAGHPAIWSWDLRNELLYTNRPHMTTPDQDAAQARIDVMLKNGWAGYLGTVTLSFSLLGLFTSRPYQNQMWQTMHETIQSGHIPDIRFV